MSKSRHLTFSRRDCPIQASSCVGTEYEDRIITRKHDRIVFAKAVKPSGFMMLTFVQYGRTCAWKIRATLPSIAMW